MDAPIFLTRGDLLKAEADEHSRIAVTAPKSLKAGQLVKYPVRNQYLVALTDELYGEVLVQPHNCTIFLDNVNQADLDAVSLTKDKMTKEGDSYGIKYQGTPYILPVATVTTPTVPTAGG